MKRTVSIIFILALSFLMSTIAQAQNDVLRVGFSEHPPWKILEEDGIPKGIDTTLLRLLADRMNLRLEFIVYPYTRSLKLMESGKLDIMTGVLKRPDREKYLYFISPPYKNHSNKTFFVLKGQESSIKSYEDLYQMRIGTGHGSKYFPQFDNDKRITKDVVHDAELSIKMLIAHRINAFIMTESSGDYRIEKLGLSDKIGKAEYGYKEKQNVYMVLSKRSKHTGRLEEFNHHMSELIENGTYDKIKLQFFEQMKAE
ncbi:substrate-binding periplasmic protein [Maridesulfovibrio frigidus]|uniref:substrate-binding periplasmic protein n=1 Tax=Maridesulfovibrio frigidus TaxID=340956 RepID=UPI0004E10E63|nr:transporter substrate-binding domain-containing protein [Maridesulfovibrio frigidus]